MIVPQARLLFWVTAIVLPFATLAGVYQPAAPICFALMGCLVVGVLIDAVLSFSGLKGISLQAPRVVRASKDRGGQIGGQSAGQSRQRLHSAGGGADDDNVPSGHRWLPVDCRRRGRRQCEQGHYIWIRAGRAGGAVRGIGGR